MPREESTENARRILAVDVREVSLVDRAANLRKFLVVKKLEGDDMGLFVSERSENMDPVEKAKKESEMTDEEKAKAKKAAEDEEAKKKADAKKAEDEEAEKAKAKKAKEEEEKAACDAKKAMNPAAVAGMIQGLKGAPKAAVDALVGWLKEQAEKAGPGKDDPYPSPNVKKSLLDEALEAILEKGAKQFTSQRADKIKEAAGALVKLLQEMDPEAAKALMNESSAKEMPEGGNLPSSITKALEDAKSENAELKKRLDALENSRQAPQGDGANKTDDKTVKKSLWDGLL